MSVIILVLVLAGATVIATVNITRSLKALSNVAEAWGTNRQIDCDFTGYSEEVREAFEAFDRMEKRVTDLLVEKDVMLGAIGHDLRTPLTSLRLRIEQMDPEHMRRNAIEAVDQMAKLLGDILDLANLGSAAEQPALYDLTSLVSDVVSDYQERRDAVVLNPSKRIISYCRPSSVRRMLENLINNAISYADQASISLVEQEKHVSIIVEDDGPGLPPEAIETLMRPFQRGENSRSRSTGGSGLGLTIAQMIARAHDTELTISNRAPNGLRVEVSLHRIPDDEGNLVAALRE